MQSNALCDFLKQAVTPYHATAKIMQILTENGFSVLREDRAWSLAVGGKYVVTRGSSALIAFVLPKEAERAPFHIAAAHNDTPCFRITGEVHDGHYVRLTVEKYGGMMTGTWFDRPLAIAGRVFVRTNEGARECLFESDARLVIPSVAIHQNTEANERVWGNPSVDMLPIFSRDFGGCALKMHIAEVLGVKEEDILSEELYLVSAEEPFVFGGDFLTAPRLDDLQCVFGLLSGLLEAAPAGAIPVLAVHDGEEVGSGTVQGADSTFLSDTLFRIREALGATVEQARALLADSFMISADNAHAVHPAHPELSAKGLSCHMGGGIVIKENASRRYTSDGYSVALLRLLCERAEVGIQCFRARADRGCGSTLGHIANTHVSVPTVDIGLAQLAMHSAVETASLSDTDALVRAAKAFFSSRKLENNGVIYWQS